MPDSVSPWHAASVYLSGGPGIPGYGTIVLVGLDIGGSGLVGFSVNPDPATAYVTLGRTLPSAVGGVVLAINSSCSPDDADGDGVLDSLDSCPNVYNPGQEESDSDGDGVGNVCDNCPDDYNPALQASPRPSPGGFTTTSVLVWSGSELSFTTAFRRLDWVRR